MSAGRHLLSYGTVSDDVSEATCWAHRYREGGPPFGIDVGEIADVLGAGLELVRLETPADSVGPRHGRERLAILRKP
jgi:hypothetical protein